MEIFTGIGICLKNQADILEVKNIVPEAKDSLGGFKSQLCKRGQNTIQQNIAKVKQREKKRMKGIEQRVRK